MQAVSIFQATVLIISLMTVATCLPRHASRTNSSDYFYTATTRYQGTERYQQAQVNQHNSGYQNVQGIQAAQTYPHTQGHQPFQGYQKAQGYRPVQGHQNAQGYQQDQWYQNAKGYQQTQRYQQEQQRIHKRQDSTTSRPKWEQQNIHPTEVPRLKGSHIGGRREDEYNTQQHSSQNYGGRKGNQNGASEFNRRLNLEDDCDDQTSTAHRRSASQDYDTRSQHTVRSSPTRKPCIQPTEPSQYPNKHNSGQDRTQSTLPRPPTPSGGLTTTTQPSPRTSVDIVFREEIALPTFVPQTQADCNENTFCETQEGYPTDHIANILKNSVSSFQGIFGVDEVEASIKQRIDGIDDNPLCASTEQVVFPKALKNKDDKKLFIVNQEPFLQGVRVETCAKEGPCQFAENLPAGYKTLCKQKYIYRKMVALNEQGEPESDAFKLPSCCSCHVKMDPVARMRGLALPNNVSSAKATPKNKP